MEDAVGARTKFKRLIEVDSMHEAPLQRPKKGRNTKQHSSFEIQEEGHNQTVMTLSWIEVMNFQTPKNLTEMVMLQRQGFS